MAGRTVVIVGGGVLGLAAAWRLAVRGARVTVCEQFPPGHDRGSSHGSSRIFRLAYDTAHHVDLAARALPLWRGLETATGRPVLTLTGAVDHGPGERVEPLRAALTAAGHRADLLDAAAAARRWPGLRFDGTVLFHPDAGRLHADDAVAALRDAAVAHGARMWHGCRVARVERRTPHGVAVVTADGASLAADAAVVAAGAWAAGLVPELPPLRVSQEQPVHFAAARPEPLAWPSFIHHREPGPDVYGLGSVDGVKVGLHGAGPTVDPDRRDRRIDPAAVEILVDYARRWLPGVDPARVSATTCLYTNTADHDFVVDRVGPVTVVSACSGHGFKFAPALGELVADLVDGRPGPAWSGLDRPLRTG